MPRWLFSVLAAGVGVAAGILYGWVINPVKFVDTTPASLREDYRTDYVLMVAEAYHADRDVELASRRLAVFGSESPADLALAAAQSGRNYGYSQDDITLLQDLTRALQASEPPASPPGGTP